VYGRAENCEDYTADRMRLMPGTEPGMGDEPAIPEVVRWIADELTAVLFDGIVAEILAED
jgi:hypothetical protein